MTILCHAFDVETTSPRLGPNRLMSIGACCLEIPSNGVVEVVDRFEANVAWPSGFVFDHEDTEAFWRKHAGAYARCTSNQVTPEAAAAALERHIRTVQEVAAKRKAKYVLVTDNSFYDVGWLDWLLSTYSATALPLRHSYTSGWLPADSAVDVTQRLRALRDIGLRVQVPRTLTCEAHTPLHDATEIAHKYAFYRRWARQHKAAS